VQIQNELTGARWKAISDRAGQYAVGGLLPGQYKLTVRLPGFRTVSRVGVTVDGEREVVFDFTMELLALHEVVMVTSGGDQLDPSTGDSLIVTHDSPGATLPTNGSDVRMLFDLMPGVVVTPAAASDGGQFTSNGQRPNANGFRVDGVSANTGVGGSTLPGSFPGASLPAMTAIGTTETLGSSETTETVEFRTSGFGAEVGGRLGSEALVTTRSGSNEFHGEFFSHLRDNDWNAQDWFANSFGIPYPRPYYRNLGGVFEGPAWRNHTFFLISTENTGLDDTGVEVTTVPSLTARQNAPASLQSVLNSFPLPTGPELGGSVAEGLLGVDRTASLGIYNGRLDQSLGSWGTLFAHYVRSVSSSDSRDNYAVQGVSDWRSATFGMTTSRSGVIDDIRLNYSRADFRSTYSNGPWSPTFSIIGLLPGNGPDGLAPSVAALFPQGTPSVYGVSIPDLGQFVSGEYGRSRQDQWAFSNTISKRIGRHAFRAGLEYLRLTASRDAPLASILGSTPSLENLLAGDPFAVTISQAPQYGGTIQIGSFFAQDTLRVADNLNLVYGVRWELTPPTGQAQLPTTSGLWTGNSWTTTFTGNINGIAPWPMRYGQFEPRIGMAYRVPRSPFVVRAGAGVFYDTTLGSSIAMDAINGAPFNSWLLLAGTLDISTPSNGSTVSILPPGSAMTPDVAQFLSGPYPPLHLPLSYQWRVSVEKAAGTSGIASVAYTGSSDKHLLGNEAYIDPATGILERSVISTASSSTYNALQVRYNGSVNKNLFLSASYTWSHCIDDGSEDSSVFLIYSGYQLNQARGSCDFDVRQTLTAAVAYHVPRSPVPVLSGWNISAILRARSGFPIDVVDTEPGLGQSFDNVGRPNLVPDVPIWISDPQIAGHRRLNPAAFSIPPAGQQGTLGRNAIYGNGLTQVDLSLRRGFELSRGTAFEIGLNVFNVLNHPAFADPVPFLSSPLFGQSISMQNLMLGSGTPSTGLPPLFQSGGSRSAELTLRFTF
jgi:hypothetical protein